MCIWVGWTSLYIILKLCQNEYKYLSPTNKFVNLWKYNYWPMITICLAICGIFFPMVLITFHCYLIATGQTTNEKAKNAFMFVSPYSRGCCMNIWENICVVTLPQSNVHIHHQPPNKSENEIIVNKRKIVYISSQDTKESIINNLHGTVNVHNKNNKSAISDPTDHEQQKLLNSRNKRKNKRKKRDHSNDDNTTQCQILPHSKCSHSNNDDEDGHHNHVDHGHYHRNHDQHTHHNHQHHHHHNNDIIEEEEIQITTTDDLNVGINIHTIERRSYDDYRVENKEREIMTIENISSPNDSSMDNNDPTPSSNAHSDDQRNKRGHNKINQQHTMIGYGSGPLNITANPSSSNEEEDDDPHQYYIAQQEKHQQTKIKRKYNRHKSKSKGSHDAPSIHHQGVGSTSGSDTHTTQQMTMTFTEPTRLGSKLKRKRKNNRSFANNNNNNNNKSNGGYNESHKKHKYGVKYLNGDTKSNSGWRGNVGSDKDPRSIQSEQIYYHGNGNGMNTTTTTATVTETTISGSTSGYHPAYERYMATQQSAPNHYHRKQIQAGQSNVTQYSHNGHGTHNVHNGHNGHNRVNSKEFAFSPLSPVNSKELGLGNDIPSYPPPHDMRPVYHDKIGNGQNMVQNNNHHQNNNQHQNNQHIKTEYLTPININTTVTPILSTNEDNHTLTSTFSLPQHPHHNNNNNKKHQMHHQYKATNSHNTLFSPEISSGYLDNIDNATNTNGSSSDYYTVPSHAHTYDNNHNHHHHDPKNNGNPFINPPSSARHHHTSQGFNNYNTHYNANHNNNNNKNNRINHRSYSHQHHHRDHKNNKSNKHRNKHNKTKKYHNVNDILELSSGNVTRYDQHRKYRNYNGTNRRRIE